ncbi:response regulator [Paenibacillus agricola]|uniref:Response regulator n=1 Tax=Paenibacillus agricola TaxID=2716264 RepID=A0ABX0J842_9BACL|nr:response regulator [Paenibacillus agricola]NHN31773.1 response regulator [Paenibacillus agricola]
MKAILIDDEKPALQHLERLLQREPDIQITGKFNTARDALQYLAHEKVDVVFLDIGMPEINGLVAAEYIQQIDSHIRIVYITAYAEYAVDAFELHALDYLLKPVHPIRFTKTLERIRQSLASPAISATRVVSKPFPSILMFMRLSFSDSLDPERRIKWRTLKSKELFAFLLHQQGEWVAKDLLLEMLWPHFTYDKAMVHMHTSVYQIRKLIKEYSLPAVLEFSMESYRLTGKGAATDADQFEQALVSFSEAREVDEGSRQRADLALKLYKGHYLEENDYQWAKPKRDHLLRLYIDASLRTAEYELNTGRERQAVDRLKEALEKDPYSEELVRLLMVGFTKLGDYKTLHSHYAAFVQLLATELEVVPQQETQQCYEQLTNR